MDLAPALRAHKAQDVETTLEEVSSILNYFPHHPVALHLKAWAISKKGQKQEALEILSGIISKNPKLVPARAEYGSILMDTSRHAEALEELKKAHGLQPQRDEVVVKYCICLIKNHSSAEAERLLIKLLERSPKDISARFALSIAMLQQGKWTQGFSQYRIRFWLDEFEKGFLKDESKLWTGEKLGGKSLLIQCEQGYGDQILFIRYASWVKQNYSPKKITVVCRPEMKTLLNGVRGVDEVVTDISNLDFDFQVPLLNLPLIHQTTPETIPYPENAYLAVSDELIDKWSSRFDKDAELIAVCWRTNLISDERSQSIDYEKRGKSLTCESAELLCYRLKELFPEATLVSLQPGVSREEEAMLKRLGIENVWQYTISDFAATAAVIQQMDLVVSIDTAVAHLAGALGQPVWTLLPHYSDWRWSQDEEFSSWYTDMRLLRQSRENDWASLDCDNRISQSN